MKPKNDVYASTAASAARLGMSFFRSVICRHGHTEEDGTTPTLRSIYTGNCVVCQANSRRAATERIRKAMHAARPMIKPIIDNGGK